MPTPTISQHSRNLGSIPGHHQHSLGMEKVPNQLISTTSIRIYSNPTISGPQFTIDIAIPTPRPRDGKIGIPPRRALQVPPSRYRQHSPTGRKT